MAYQVIARKFRPQTFAELVGQQHVARTLQNAIKIGRIPHSFLFTGTRGVGKTSAARVLAKALNCVNGPTPEPCNTCDNCKSIVLGNHLDVFEIDGASNRGIDEIRDLREKINYSPANANYKIYIIDEVHMLTQEAFNALLKTLEEPPEHVKFIFATTESHKIPITILSRCQRYDFRKINVKEITDRLSEICRTESIQAEFKDLQTIARESGGSMRDAQSLLDQIIAFTDGKLSGNLIEEILGVFNQNRIYEYVEYLLNADVLSALTLIKEADEAGHDFVKFTLAITETLKDLLIIARVKDPGSILLRSSDEIEHLRRLVAIRTIFELELLTELFLRGYQNIINFDNPRLYLEFIFFKSLSLKDLVPVEQILDQLQRLEKKKFD